MRLKRHMRWWVGLLVAVASVTVAANDPDLRLIEAIKSKNKDAARSLLKQGVDVKARRGDGATALHWAAHWDDVETADLLIRAGAPVNAANDHGVTPLWLGSLNGKTAMVERLLQAGADPNVAIASGETPLMTAARGGNAEVVKLLLKHGANVGATERLKGQTALMWAVAQRQSDVVRVLVEHGADAHARMLTWFEDVATAYSAGAPATGSAVGLAASGSRYIHKNWPLGGYTAFLFAAQQGDIESGQLLLSAGANVDDAAPDGTSALVLAAHSGRSAFAEWLLEQGADPNHEGAGYSALHAAVVRNDIGLVKTLLARGANPNAPLKKATPTRYHQHDYWLMPLWVGGTPFWIAAQLAESEIMRVLAAAGANPKIGLDNGVTPIMAAMIYNPDFFPVKPPKSESPRVVEGDPRRGWSLRTQQRQSRTDEGDERVALEAVKAAVDSGADVNATTVHGDTALHVAAAQGLNTIIQFLVERGAKLDVKNKNGLTPLDVARRRSVDLLRQLSAAAPR